MIGWVQLQRPARFRFRLGLAGRRAPSRPLCCEAVRRACPHVGMVLPRLDECVRARERTAIDERSSMALLTAHGVPGLVLPRRSDARMGQVVLSGVRALVHAKGRACWLWARMKSMTRLTSSSRDPNSPRLSSRRVRIEKNNSTWFNQEACLGV